MKRYLYDFWNGVDLLSYALLIVALFVRHVHQSKPFTDARRIYALSLLVMYLRFLEVFLIHRKLGPTLIMIKEMVCVLDCIIILFYLFQICLIKKDYTLCKLTDRVLFYIIISLFIFIYNRCWDAPENIFSLWSIQKYCSQISFQ